MDHQVAAGDEDKNGVETIYHKVLKVMECHLSPLQKG
jgi:hypothetical protein